MRKLSLLLTMALAVAISSCKRNSIHLDFTSAKDEVPMLGNLVFRFNQGLVADSMLNAWDSTEYVTFSPKIPGRFRWESPDQLVFSPSGPLLPATDYSAHIGKEVLRFSKYNSVEGGDEIRFHTPPLTLDNTQVIWMLQGEGSTSAMPQVDLQFNYLVNPGELGEKLRLESEGKKLEYQIITMSPASTISCRITSLGMSDRDYEVKLMIEKGLKPHTGNNKTGATLSSSIVIPSPYVLTIQDMVSEHDGVDGTVKVSTSQQVGVSDIKNYIRIDPAVSFTIEQGENGFTIRSDKFDLEKSYSITIAKGLRGRIGGVLKEDYFGNVAFGELEAAINFTNSKAVYLSKKGAGNIEVQITNVQKVKVLVSKIYESNLLLIQRYGYYPRETDARYASYEEDYDAVSSSDVMLGDVIYEKEIDTRSLPKSGGGRLFNLADIEDRLQDFKGIYHVMIRSSEDYWVRDSRYISLSDLGLIAKEGHEKIFVFTNSIKTAGPMADVTVSVYSANNQLIGTGSSNAEGVAEIAFSKKDYSGFRPAMVIAKTGDDFNYLPFGETRVNLSRFDVSGKRNNPSGLDAFVYAERDIYRPGEKINFSVVIRDRQWKSPGQVPLKLKMLLPNGKELKSFRKTLNEEGSIEDDIALDNAAITGAYTLEVYTSNDVLLAAKNFSVEEFVPDRIRVSAKIEKATLRPGESTQVAVNAMNFFGPPAANRNYEMEIQVKQRNFSPAKFNNFDFSLTNQGSVWDKVVKDGKTDEEGNAVVDYTAPDSYKNTGLLQVNFYTTVFDETGRPVSRMTSADIFTQDVFFGIGTDWNYYFPLNQKINFQLASVNKDGNAVSSKARVVVIKHEYRTVLTRSGSYFRYESQKEDRQMIESEVTVGANTVYSYVPRTPGDYELRVYQPGAGAYVRRSFYSYGSWGGTNTSFEVNTEGNIEIELDRKSYLAGERVKALFKTPFSGRMLVTMETDHVVSYQYVEVANRSASAELPLTGEHIPNVYITATLIRPHEASDIPLTVAHGFQNVKVEEKKRMINVAITAQKKVRSQTKQKVQVKAVPGSYVTLSAVDNGVLQVSGFETPDPYGYFYQKRALQVAAYDIYPLLFAELRATRSSTGGDGEMDMAKRVNPMPAKRIKVVSYWSGIRKANSSGVAEFEFDIPKFSGEIRLMAVAYKGECFGGADNTMTVADPIVISTALPRFLSPGDTINVPITMSNTTAKSSKVTATVKVEGPLRVVEQGAREISLNANSEGRAVFSIVAGNTIGVGKVQVQVNGMGEKFGDETEISVRPPSTLQKLAGGGSINAGSTQRVSIGLEDFIPGSTDYTLSVSRSPVMELGEHLRYLVQYPYGCTEQTISAAFPQLYYGDLSDLLQSGTSTGRQNKANANNNILEAIRKIRMRQLYNGAVTLWDGEGKEDWWTTVYAAHFLYEARRAGFNVDNGLFETMLNYLANRLKSRETITYYYNRNQNKKIAPKEVAYSLYVLALAGRSNVPAMNYYKAHPELLALDSRYLLSATYAMAGDKRSYAAMLPSSFAGEESVPQTGGSYYSDIRDEAIALNALLSVDPGHAQVPVMARHISAKLKSRSWLSTQERAFSFLALGKVARTANASSATAEIRVNGKTVAKVDGGQWTGDMKSLKSADIEIVVKGKGQLYYSWEAEGISSTGAYKEEDSYIRVRRRFYDRFGTPITGNTFKQNDLVIVGITLERTFSTDVENIVITDLLPAGFEIENPRTKEIPGMDWIKDASTPTALDVRDDRIHFFVDATSNRQVYYYAVRAVTPGQFKMGPVSADAMYNGEYHSYHGAGVVKVRE